MADNDTPGSKYRVRTGYYMGKSYVARNRKINEDPSLWQRILVGLRRLWLR